MIKNRLKDLIYIQENKPCNEQTIRGLFRSIVESILEDNTQNLVLLRLKEERKALFSSLLKRLEYSNSKVYDFSNESIFEKFENILKEKIWDETEFVYVLAERFGAVLIFDFEHSKIENMAEFYILHNSKILDESFDIINSNSKVDLSEYKEKFRPDRRDNLILNSSIRKIVESLNETAQDAMISEMEVQDAGDNKELKEMLDFVSNKSRYVSHEIRNQLSICDLYSNIIVKQIEKLDLKDEPAAKSINNAINCIKKAIKIVDSNLIDLKSLNNNSPKEHNLEYLIDTAIELSKIYTGEKQIKIKGKAEDSITVLVDENKFLAVLINLIKNAIESISEKGEINILSTTDEEYVSIIVENNGRMIQKELQSKIYEDGFTTKETGSGLGLYICKKAIEEQFGQLKLKKSDEKSTEFEIILPLI